MVSAEANLAYVEDYLQEDEPLLAARRAAAEVGGATPVGPAVGAALRFIAAAINARSVVEIGTGCGTSGIWLLRGMRSDAVLTSVDADGNKFDLTGKPAFSLCRCGGSVTKPFCDGTHSKIGFQAAEKAVPESAE